MLYVHSVNMRPSRTCVWILLKLRAYLTRLTYTSSCEILGVNVKRNLGLSVKTVVHIFHNCTRKSKFVLA